MKKLLWTINLSGVQVLIPCKHKAGYLKQPIGHHVNKLSQWIDYNIRLDDERLDVTGLDGYLHFNTGYLSIDMMPQIENEIINPLAQYFKHQYGACEYEYIDHDNFQLTVATNLQLK